MYNNILLPYSFDNDFSNIPDQLKKIVNEKTNITIYHVVTENELADNVKFHDKHKTDIIKDKEKEVSPFLRKLDERNINYKFEVAFGHIKETILKKIKYGDINTGSFDLIIMSNHRNDLNIKYILGDITHKIAKRSPIPVLIIK